jgi:hypothetical protein
VPEVLLDPAAIRARMHALKLDPRWVAVRSGTAIGGSALRRALNGKPITRSKAKVLAHVLRCPLEEIAAK